MTVTLSHYSKDCTTKIVAKEEKKMEGPLQNMNEKSENFYGNLRESLISNSHRVNINENQV